VRVVEVWGRREREDATSDVLIGTVARVYGDSQRKLLAYLGITTPDCQSPFTLIIEDWIHLYHNLETEVKVNKQCDIFSHLENVAEHSEGILKQAQILDTTLLGVTIILLLLRCILDH
jgi:hypothetical protein